MMSHLGFLPPAPILAQVHRQASATAVNVNGSDPGGVFPPANAKVLDGANFFRSEAPYPGYHVGMYFDLLAEKRIYNIQVQNAWVNAYADGTPQDVYAGVWGSHDASNWVLLDSSLVGPSTGFYGPYRTYNATYRYIAVGIYAYYVYDGSFQLDCLEIVGEP